MSHRRIPELHRPEDVVRWASEIVRILNNIDHDATEVASTGWEMSNVTTDRVLDADATTLAEVADVLATLINDLKSKGILG